MRKKLTLLIAAISCFLFGCQKKFEQPIMSESENYRTAKVIFTEASPNGVLYFNSKEEFKQYITAITKDSDLKKEIVPEGFNSFYNLRKEFQEKKKIDIEKTFIRNILKESYNVFNKTISTESNSADSEYEQGSLSDFVYSSYINLVPDEAISTLLNTDLQVMIANDLFQITPLGTFQVPSENMHTFTNWIETNSTEIWTDPNFQIQGEANMGNGLYQTPEGFYRQEIDAFSIVETSNSSTPPVILMPPSSGPSPAGPNIPLNLVIANSRGEGKGIVSLPDNRRFNFHSYNNRYIFWNSIGIEGKVQRLRKVLWISYWGQSFGDEIIIGIDNLDLETDYFIPTPQQQAAMQMALPKFKGFKKLKIGNYITDFLDFAFGSTILPFIPNRFSFATHQNFINGIINSPQATNLVNDEMKKIIPGIIDQYVDPTFKDRYKNEPVYITSYKSVSQQSMLRFTAAQAYKKQGYSDNNNWRFDWNIMISTIGDTPYDYKMKSGNFIGKAKVGNNWAGIRIVKYK
ncbi:MAG: hypothetical protein K2Y12_01670 [Chitinophagaceae bacterium]|nr:hypothetical protein [Chitinophagaceae bacterium]